jgi:hypothetical protein
MKRIGKNSTDLAELIRKEGKFYHADGKTPFSGKYHWLYDNGVIAEEGTMKGGLYHGRVLLYNEDEY